LQRAKRLFFANKAGHTGALDPLATGVLPLCFGEATKFSQYLLDADTQADVEQAMASFRGDIAQVPPMYSALKKDGQPLYKLARKGIEVERKARNVTIFDYQLLDFVAGDQPQAKVLIHCTKGTYVRSLAADLGEALGVGAHVADLHREKAGPFENAQALDLTALEQERGDDRAEVLDQVIRCASSTNLDVF